MKSIKLLSTLFLTILLFSSCVEKEEIEEPLGDYEHGFFVLNEGNWGSGNASITYLSEDYSTLETEVYKTVNIESLGDVAQDVLFHNEKAYIVMNGSDKVVVVNRYTMEHLSVIEGSEIKNPSFMIMYNGKGYLSNWGIGSDASDDTIVVIDLASDTIVNTIPVGFVPNRLAVVNDKLYVELQGWYPNNDSQVEVIDLITNVSIKTIEVGNYPHSLMTYNDKVYVLSNNHIIEINTSNDTISRTLTGGDTDYFNYLTNNGDDLYYSLNNNIYKWNIGEISLPNVEDIELGISIYGMKVYNGFLYVNHYADWQTGESLMNIYDTSTKNLIKEGISTGIYSKTVAFN
ncbi:MAG TPA: hypothetical protein EYG92_01905 [Lutibacter sp.]|nr:hypothetical protein [Lutibacter sp.]